MPENGTIKTVTIALIAVGAYILLRSSKAAPGAPVPPYGVAPYCNLKTRPMESSTCAIPLAADYLGCDYAYNPAVSAITQRPPRVWGAGRQTQSYVPGASYPTGVKPFGGIPAQLQFEETCANRAIPFSNEIYHCCAASCSCAGGI